MRKIELIYVEVMNETEQVLVFETTFNKHEYAIPIILNMALPIEIQDKQLCEVFDALTGMTREDAAGAVAMNENSE